MISRTMLRVFFSAVAATLILLNPATTTTAAAGDSIPVESFSKKSIFTNLKLSPDGLYVAALVPGQRHSYVVMIRVADFKAVGQLRLDSEDHIIAFWWIGNDRIVASLGYQTGPLDPPVATGELVAVDVDGKNFQYVFGVRSSRGATSNARSRHSGVRASAWMIQPYIDNPDEIFIGVQEWGRAGNRYATANRLNLKTGDLTTLAFSPELDIPTHFVLDREGKVRYAITTAGEFDQKTWQIPPGKREWQRVQVPGDSPPIPLGFSRSGDSIFLSSREFGPRACLVQHVLSSGERRKLACDDDADLDEVIFSFESFGEPIAAVFSAGRPKIVLLDSMHPHRELLMQLMEAFPGKHIMPTSFTRDGRKALIFVFDDRSPGDYYLFDTETHKADYFAGERDWIDPDQMSERRPIQLKARDGTPLWGYLTLPKGKDPAKLPLVVNPHGGPFYVRDNWGFDTEAQLLASRGYAVLQVNFRGSDGYGSRFITAGKKAWATTMIDDITDATRWTIAQGFADPSRICIYGVSFGGYAALMSAVREPDLYQCVVGYAGAYDLKRLKQDSDITDSASGRKFFAEAIAGTDAELAAQSPTSYLDRLKVPMLIVHGEDDKRAPLSQAKLLKKALEAGKHPYQWLVKADEGHGFWRVENINSLYVTLLAFIDQNIGPDKAAVTSASTPEAVATP